MPSTDRRGRDREQRHQLIITAARELAEAEGWDAVTTRRLAERVEYSQPVLYGHFESKDAIVRAVAMEGFEELAAQLRSARLAAGLPEWALRTVCNAYLAFAADHASLYQAMFALPTDLDFASAETPPPLRAAFAEFVATVAPHCEQHELYAEVTWSTLHGMVVLAQSGRIPPERQAARVDVLVSRITRAPGR